MTSKLITILFISCLILYIYNLRIKLKHESETNKLYRSQIDTISRRNETNLNDLQKRNEELKERNEELKLYILELNNIKDDNCLNANVSDSVIRLLQKAGI